MNTSRTPVRWLQLSDLHVIPDSPAWDEFEKDYRAFLANNPEISPDFVLVSGDYRNIKTTSPFGPAITFLQAIKNALQLKDDCFFMVPGNHDMAPKRAETDRRTAEMKKLLPLDVTPWEHVDEKTAEMHRELCENEPSDYLDRLCKISRTEGENPNTVTWEILSDGFAEYSDQARKLVPWYKSEDRKPTEPQLRIWKAINSDRAVQCIIIIHLNTAIIADGSRSHYQAIDFNKTKNVFDRAAENKYPSIILAHNSFYDLHGQIQKHLRPLLIQANTCCWVCGDAHKFDNKEIMCPIDNDGVFYSVPIFVCAKSAADHGDDFSDVGFMYYEANGEEIQSTEYIWSKNLHGISTGDVVTKKFANPSNPEFNGKLRVGYLSCSPDEEAKSKYHLGHAYFIYMIDEWRKSGHVLLLSSSHSNEHNRKVNTLEKKEEDMKSLRLRWEDCFGGDDIHFEFSYF